MLKMCKQNLVYEVYLCWLFLLLPRVIQKCAKSNAAESINGFGGRRQIVVGKAVNLKSMVSVHCTCFLQRGITMRSCCFDTDFASQTVVDPGLTRRGTGRGGGFGGLGRRLE